MENYKGIYYNEEKEPKLYEGGAHFKYNKLYTILLSLGGVLVDDDSHSISKYRKKGHIKSNKDINSLLIKVREKKSKYKTRNLAALIYDNSPNPNTRKKHDNPFNTKNTLSKKDFNSRNHNKDNIMNKKYNYYKKAITSVSINNLHKKKTRINNDLINIILRKKEIDSKIQDKNNENNNKNRLSLFNYSRYIHNRNRSESLSNMNNSTFNNNISHTQRFENGDKTFMKSIDNRILVNKKTNFNTHNTTTKNNKEVNGKENNIKNENDKPKVAIKIKKFPLIYGKTKINNILKENSKVNNQLSFYTNKSKKSRNNVYKKIINNNKSTCENNKTKNDNYQKKLIKKCYFNKKEKNKEDKKNVINKTINNISCLNSNRFKDFNTKNKEKVLKSNGNINLVQKYIRKKIKQMCVFNHNNGKMKKISKSIDQE